MICLSKKEALLINKIVFYYNRLSDAQIFSSSAELSYYMILTLFPVLIVINALLSFFASDAGEISEMIGIFLPDHTVSLLDEYLAYQKENSSTRFLMIGIGLTLTSMSTMTKAVRSKFSLLYGNKFVHKRGSLIGWAIQKSFSLILSAFICFLIYGFALFLLLGEQILNRLLVYLFPHIMTGNYLTLIRYLPLGASLYLFFCFIYKFAPGIKLHYRDVKKGAGVCTCLLLGISFLYSAYINTYASYSFVYGSLASFIVTLLWIYLTNLLFLVGGYVNAMQYKKEMTAIYGHFKTDIMG